MKSLSVLCVLFYVFRWAVLVSGPCQSLGWSSSEYHRRSGCLLSHRHCLHTLQLPRKDLHHQGTIITITHYYCCCHHSYNRCVAALPLLRLILSLLKCLNWILCSPGYCYDFTTTTDTSTTTINKLLYCNNNFWTTIIDTRLVLLILLLPSQQQQKVPLFSPGVRDLKSEMIPQFFVFQN